MLRMSDGCGLLGGLAVIGSGITETPITRQGHSPLCGGR